ncbi:MAG: hypothetical protein KME49_08700 [Brasilonema octagenarum HA4186-MV1]|nr:hypothetical protein [Brasilonema octagenarum HA4186-MV1]
MKNAVYRWREGLAEFPQKKSKKKGDSFTVYKTAGVYPEKGKPPLPFTNRVTILAGKQIKLPGLKTFRLKERIDFICSFQTFTVSISADKWFVSFVLGALKIPPIVHPVLIAGVDLGVKCLATVSDGSKYDIPVTTMIAKTKLGKLQWRNRNKVLGNKKFQIIASNKVKKYYIRLSRQHLRISNIRQDTTQNMTTDLIPVLCKLALNTYSLILGVLGVLAVRLINIKCIFMENWYESQSVQHSDRRS